MAYSALLRQIYQVGFALLELNLYLDTHPEDAAALAMFLSQQEVYHTLVAQYSATEGPLTATDSTNTSNWDWATLPWPWEV